MSYHLLLFCRFRIGLITVEEPPPIHFLFVLAESLNKLSVFCIVGEVFHVDPGILYAPQIFHLILSCNPVRGSICLDEYVVVSFDAAAGRTEKRSILRILDDFDLVMGDRANGPTVGAFVKFFVELECIQLGFNTQG